MTLKRTAFKRSARPTGILAQASFAKVRKPMKKSRPKMTPIRASARNEECTMQIPGICNRDPATVVWAHSNNAVDGKGAGIKARDEEGCYACFTCHSFYDGGYANAGWDRSALNSYFNRARALSREILRRKGLLA
jgi:hypothetical protein